MTVAPSGAGTAIVLAGGSGTRMGLDQNKVYLRVGGRTVLGRSLATFAASAAFGRLVVVRRPVDADLVEAVLAEEGLRDEVVVVDGGATRHHSERCGLAAVAVETGTFPAAPGDGPAADGIVAIHDGARPFLTHTLLDALVAAARRSGGAIPALPLDGDIGRVVAGGSGPRLVVEHVGSTALRRVQTPQVFRTRPLLDAYGRAPDDFDGFDTAQVVERHGDPADGVVVEAVAGDRRNLKITTIDDVARAEELAARWEHGRWVDLDAVTPASW